MKIIISQNLQLRLAQLLVISIIVLISPSIVRSHSPSPLRGVSPQDEKYYSSSSVTTSGFIKCKDGSKKISVTQINDDFCDCPDASDEPGTSACPNGKFYCRNAGHIPLTLFSSRVNDGICDCCDGSDEYDGKVMCTNTCWEAGKVARERLKKKIATFQEGVTLRRKEIEQAKEGFVKDEAELSKLKNEEKILKGLVDQLNDRKEQIEKAEEKERLEKEKEEKLRKEAEKNSELENKEAEIGEAEKENLGEATHADVKGNDEDSIDQGIGEDESEVEHADISKDENLPTVAADQPAMENDKEDTVVPASGTEPEHEHETAETEENTEGLSKEELGRLVASRWTGEKADNKDDAGDDVKDTTGTEETSKDVPEDYGYNSEQDDDDDDHRYDEHDGDDHVDDDVTEGHGDSYSYKSDSEDDFSESDYAATSNPSWLEKIQKTVKNLLQAVNLFQTPLNISDAAVVRKEYDDSSSKLSKIQSRISSLSEKLKLDFGPDKEFYSFYDRCFESKQNKYVYKVCPFKKATQEEGHSVSRLGQWEKFDDGYKTMLFSNGDRCWNGPDRSMKVKLRCGLKNELTDVDEPSRCEYLALLSTPSVCNEEKLKELQQKLDALIKELPSNHDEL